MTKIIIIIIVNLLLFRQLRFNFEKESNHFTNQIIKLKTLDKYKFHILSDKAFREAVFVVVLFILFTMITSLCIYYLNINTKNIYFINVIFETASTISNTGLSTGITTMHLDSFSKLILSFNMIMGRFEIIAILYIFISKLRV